ncbi:ABC transporter substrate-binding protein [Jiangella gansuensis]|uniref:ABC transporter substrate-binding protein n=1 Tax=Jiangella gansuensis TaxID=281473 RepID=UPI00146FB9EC|nr:ABC transporter substrate-binding protein [Jiangella gansuensis]
MTRVVGALAALGLMAACSSAADDDSTGGSESGGGDEKVLNVWLYQEPRQLNPLLGKNGPDEQLMMLVYDYLFAATPEGEIEGSLAESWEISDDATTYTIELVDTVWSDGEPFTADDVVFSYSLLADPAISSQAANLAGIVGVQEYLDGTAETIAGLRAEDERTLVVELAEPNAAWVEQMSTSHFVIPEHILGEVPKDQILEHEFFNAPTVAIGPFTFVDWQQGQYVELEKNDQYRADVGIDRMFMVQANSDVATAQLETGDLDLAFASPTDVDRLKQVEGLVVQEAPGIGQIRLAAATDSDLLGDKRVRQAIMYGIDRQGIVDQALGGYGEVYDIPFIGPDWAVPGDLGTYDYNPEKAKELLAEAGWVPGTTVRLNIIPGTRDRDTTAEIIQGQLGEIGMDIQIQQMEAGPFVDALNARDADLALHGGGIQHIHPNLEAIIHLCSTAKPNGPNNAAYCNPEVDRLFTEGRATTDPDERATIYQELSRILFDEVPNIWLYSPELVWVYTDRLQGFEPIGDFATAFWNAAEWKLSD